VVGSGVLLDDVEAPELDLELGASAATAGEADGIDHCFDPTDWGATVDSSDDELREARRRHTAAWLVWCHEHSVSPLNALLERRRLRELAFPTGVVNQ
jgi:hypothetical protein